LGKDCATDKEDIRGRFRRIFKKLLGITNASLLSAPDPFMWRVYNQEIPVRWAGIEHILNSVHSYSNLSFMGDSFGF